MKMISLENSLLTVSISTKGAELQSIKHPTEGIEYLWQGDPTFWGRKAPVLFPIVGRLQNDQYRYKGKTYPLNQHGFARDSEFHVEEQTATMVRLTTYSTPDTKKYYPFDFQLTLIYTLEANTVNVSYLVKNTHASEELYFSIGGHPGFNVPMTSDTTFEDYYLSFLPRRTRGQIPLDGSYLDLENKTLGQTNTEIALKRTLFNNDALIYETKGKNTFSIHSEKTTHSVSLTFEDFPFTGIWSPPKKEAPFVCIEPWFGIADTTDFTGELNEKLGIQHLKGKEAFSANYTISLS
ncbi:aldose 1-epimerase family protein [Carnobacterium sp. ISL-102]|uniref:aldose 1-epimerase family protein n=1 Tax=Carnobacterium sp. ISL-102 TaxID=2819142 RepID=UPI001BE91184|nr:aldose 1-epimerase family protein [Carnobacterium sp. ISL-102]MBT2731377.1 aldose 1-epimerase family protein [Carnobacterium sp. ISL-102]